MTPERAKLIAEIARRVAGLNIDPSGPPPPPVPYRTRAKRKSWQRPSDNAILIKKLIQLRMSGVDTIEGDETAPLPMTWDDFRDWRCRTTAEMISLPVICPLRCCRRSRKGYQAVCLERHSEKAARRINLMMGCPSPTFPTRRRMTGVGEGRWTKIFVAQLAIVRSTAITSSCARKVPK
jgi:hypothetical protein